jgi:hypothetical protein
MNIDDDGSTSTSVDPSWHEYPCHVTEQSDEYRDGLPPGYLKNISNRVAHFKIGDVVRPKCLPQYPFDKKDQVIKRKDPLVVKKLRTTKSSPTMLEFEGYRGEFEPGFFTKI